MIGRSLRKHLFALASSVDVGLMMRMGVVDWMSHNASTALGAHGGE